MKKVYIIGGEQTDYERNWAKEGKSFIAMLREVIEDSFSKTDIDYSIISDLNKKRRIGLFIGNFAGELYFNQGHLGAFFTEIHPAFIGAPAGRYEAACASGSIAIDAASAKIKADEIDMAIVVGIEMMKTVSPLEGSSFLGTAAHFEKEAKGIDFPFPKLFGRLADVIAAKYKLKEERFLNALSEISNINYQNAKRNPKAQTRNWFMNKEHANTRNVENNQAVGGMLCVSDCSQITDGAALLILVSEKYAQEYASQRSKPVEGIPLIKGSALRVAPVLFSDKISHAQNNEYTLPWTKEAIDDALKSANINIQNIDFIETHDCFTSSEYAAISCFGLTAPGKEYEAIESGIIDFTGAKPINPSGGLIGVGHPVGASGVRMMLDLYKQITGTAGDYQIKKADNGIMLNIGGSATTNCVYIVGR